MKNAALSSALILASAAPLHAEWADKTWELNKDKSLYRCVRCTDADIQYRTAYNAILEKMQDWVTPELNEISTWLSSLSFAPAKFSAAGPRYYVLAPRGRSEKALEVLSKEFASYHPSDGIRLGYDDFMVPLWAGERAESVEKIHVDTKTVEGDADSKEGATKEEAIIALQDYNDDMKIENATTLAHETYHGVQAAHRQSRSTQPMTWFSESTPEAVGRAWAEKKYGVLEFSKNVDYSEPLHSPVDEYSRDHFFYYLGKLMGSEPAIRYLDELDSKSGYDGHDGLKWLEDFLASHGGYSGGLAEVYPRLIADYAQAAGLFGDASSEKTLHTEVAPGDAIDTQSMERKINEVAAIYAEAEGVFTGGWSSLEDKDRFYVNALSIDSAERKDEARLIVGSRIVLRDERHITPVFAEAGKSGNSMKVRVTNVADVAYESKKQTVKLALETSRVDISLPSCMSPGQEIDLSIKSSLSDDELRSLLAFGPHALKVSAGSLSGDLSTYTAPGSAGEVRFSVDIQTPEGKAKTLEFSPVQVSEDGCMVRLTVGGTVMTYIGGAEYTENKVSAGNIAVYLKEDDIAIYQGGWQPIPPQAKAMMTGNVTDGMQDNMSGTAAEFMKGDDFGAHNMPLKFSERFSWSNLKAMMASTGGGKTREAVPCPDGGEGCSGITFSMGGSPVPIVFDAAGRPLSMTMEGQSMIFEYGGFQVRRPPGW